MEKEGLAMKKTYGKKVVGFVCLLVLGSVFSTLAGEIKYPTRAIEYVVPFPA